MTGAIERSDEELMSRMLASEVDALEVLYDRYHRLALALAFRVLNDRESAEEVVQETFLSVWRNAATFRPELGALKGWLLTIARNRALSRLRRQPAQGQVAELDESLPDHRSPEPWELVDQRLQRERVLMALEVLPPHQRQTLELAYYGGLTHQEIAERTGLPLGTVKGRLRLAMDKLRVALADLAVDQGGGE